MASRVIDLEGAVDRLLENRKIKQLSEGSLVSRQDNWDEVLRDTIAPDYVHILREEDTLIVRPFKVLPASLEDVTPYSVSPYTALTLYQENMVRVQIADFARKNKLKKYDLMFKEGSYIVSELSEGMEYQRGQMSVTIEVPREDFTATQQAISKMNGIDGYFPYNVHFTVNGKFFTLHDVQDNEAPSTHKIYLDPSIAGSVQYDNYRGENIVRTTTVPAIRLAKKLINVA